MRLPDDPESPEFWAKLAEIRSSNSRSVEPDKRSFNYLMKNYKESSEYNDLAERTRSEYAKFLDIIGEAWGRLRFADLTRQHVRQLRDAYRNTPTKANQLLTVLRLLLYYAMECDLIKTNPAARFRRLKTGEGYRPWEEDEIAKFRETWAPGTTERMAFELLLNTGQRSGDVRKLLRAHFQDAIISVKQQKTTTRVWVPVADDLAAVLHPWLQSHGHKHVVCQADGRPLTASVLSHMLRDACSAAKLPKECVPHGLHYAAAARLAELGCAYDVIASITGHETVRMVQLYTEKLRRARLAISALNAGTRANTLQPARQAP